jgi:hypothetical protein
MWYMPVLDRYIYCCLFSCHYCLLSDFTGAYIYIYIYCCILSCTLCCILFVSHATYDGTPFRYYARDRRQEYGPSLLCTSNGYSYTVLFLAFHFLDIPYSACCRYRTWVIYMYNYISKTCNEYSTYAVCTIMAQPECCNPVSTRQGQRRQTSPELWPLTCLKVKAVSLLHVARLP